MRRRGSTRALAVVFSVAIVVILAVAFFYYMRPPPPQEDTEPPNAEAVADENTVVGEEVSLDAGGSTDNVGITEYLWDLGDGETASGATAKHSYSEAGTYTVTLTVRDEARNTDTDTVTITVAETPDETPPTAVAGPDMSAEIGQVLTFDASGSGDNVGIVSYEWDFGDGSTASGVVVQHGYSVNGTYLVTLTVRDEAGNSDSDTLEALVEAPPEEDNVPPVAEAGPDMAGVVGEALEFDASDSTDNVGIVSYEWNFGDGESAAGVTASHAYAEPGNYTVTLTVKDAAGNSGSDTLTVTVSEAVVKPTIDGLIGEGEYPHNTTHSLTGITVYWYNDGEEIYVGMVGPGTGWVAVGFDPVFVMNGANFIMGYVSGNETVVSDEFGTTVSSHAADTTIGGTFDVTEYAGIEAGGETTIEFRMPLDSGDARDKPLSPGGTYRVLVSYNSSMDDFQAKHTMMGSITVTLD